MSVRVRYAPSPTGLQHIGGVRTALFNYFFARSNGGTFILRIEDTDQERYSEDALSDLYETFEWLGIRWDEGPDVGGKHGPYIQSKRTNLYRTLCGELVRKGWAYPCFCTSERLAALREEQKQNKDSFGYDRKCRDLSPELAADNMKTGMPHVVRFKVPLEGSTKFHDQLLGDVEQANRDVNPDPVLLKSDGFPTYHLANVIDDHFMKITHILRAQEWIPSGTLHTLLYQAFGWKQPAYCHLPMVMGQDGQKLSKRHGSTSLKDFRNSGYLKEAIINCVSLIGWSYDDSRELFSKEELEKLFDITKLNKAPGVFDYKKLDWFNGHYIRQKRDEELAELVMPYLLRDGLIKDSEAEPAREVLLRAIPLVKERLKTLSDAGPMLGFLFGRLPDYPAEELVPKKYDAGRTLPLFEELSALAADFGKRTDEENEELFKARATELDVKLSDFLLPLRVAITGSRVSPPLFGSIRLLGADETVARLSKARIALEKTMGGI